METTNKNEYRKRKMFFLPLFIMGFFGMSAIVMLLWNWILPGISTLSPLGYWQAMGLLVLCRILFGGFHFNRHHRKVHEHFAQHAPFKDKFMDMSETEKSDFKNQWKSRCCSK
jgi:hypothetical protein